LEQYQEENRAEEQRCLKEVRHRGGRREWGGKGGGEEGKGNGEGVGGEGREWGKGRGGGGLKVTDT
jgi:hypothetical protein